MALWPCGGRIRERLTCSWRRQPNQKKQRKIRTPSRGGWGEGGIVTLGLVVRSVRSALYEIA